MKNKSILLKSIISGSVYLIFLLLLIFVVYVLDFFEGALFLGVLCGIILAVVTRCNTLKRTLMARFVGLLAAFVAHIIFEIIGFPYKILMYIFRNDSFVSEMGRLTVNETIGYSWGRMFLWGGLIISFILVAICLFIFDAVKKHQSSRAE